MVLWKGEPWELVEKSCDEGSFENESFTEGIKFALEFHFDT